jgi:hypothetical protein
VEGDGEDHIRFLYCNTRLIYIRHPVSGNFLDIFACLMSFVLDIVRRELGVNSLNMHVSIVVKLNTCRMDKSELLLVLEELCQPK